MRQYPRSVEALEEHMVLRGMKPLWRLTHPEAYIRTQYMVAYQMWLLLSEEDLPAASLDCEFVTGLEDYRGFGYDVAREIISVVARLYLAGGLD